jgi:hypothetical protein
LLIRHPCPKSETAGLTIASFDCSIYIDRTWRS